MSHQVYRLHKEGGVVNGFSTAQWKTDSWFSPPSHAFKACTLCALQRAIWREKKTTVLQSSHVLLKL